MAPRPFVPSAILPDIDQGWDGWVKRPNIAPDRHGEPANNANAHLWRPATNSHIGLWVNNLQAQFTMSGTTGQSKDRRQFFPHNFTAPSFTISGQTTNSYQYNRLSRFIAESQRNLALGLEDFIQFHMPSPTDPEDVSTKLDYPMRGSRSDIMLDGYVGSIEAGAERFVNAPDYSFSFIVTDAVQFPGLDDVSIHSSVSQALLKGLDINENFLADRSFVKPSKPKSTKTKKVPRHQDPPDAASLIPLFSEFPI